MNFTSILMSVCKSAKTWFRRTWQLPSNAHAYRLYIFNEPAKQMRLTFVWLLSLDEQSFALWHRFSNPSRQEAFTFLPPPCSDRCWQRSGRARFFANQSSRSLELYAGFSSLVNRAENSFFGATVANGKLGKLNPAFLTCGVRRLDSHRP